MVEVAPENDSFESKSLKIRIILADDHPLLRKATRIALQSQSDFEVVAEAKDGEEAVALTTKLVPDVVIMDLSMPKLNGLEATKQIKATLPKILVLVLTVHNDSEHIINILQAGAGGYLTKSADDKELINAIRALVSGDTVLSPEVTQQITKYAFQYMAKPVSLDTSCRLTVRELETLKLIARGLSNKDIAFSLGLSQRTVKGYLADLFVKLNVASRTEAVVVGLRKGILTLHDIE